VAIFGWKSARRRLREATRESLTIPAFSSIDSTPWVTGGLWPHELSPITSVNAALAYHLREDLQRITRSANAELTLIHRAGLPGFARDAQQARVISEARARVTQRVELTRRRIRAMTAAEPTEYRLVQSKTRITVGDNEKTQVIPAVTDRLPALDESIDTIAQPRKPGADDRHDPSAATTAPNDPSVGDSEGNTALSTGRHRATDDDGATTAVTTSDAPGPTRHRTSEHATAGPRRPRPPPRPQPSSCPRPQRPGRPLSAHAAEFHWHRGKIARQCRPVSRAAARLSPQPPDTLAAR
jgi:hypothetical protein